MRRG
ncbi:LIM domain-containing protein PLIM2b [Zea mays]|jgi:hypothetical protein